MAIPSASSTSSTTVESPVASEGCRQLLGAEDVLVIVKTGATVLRERLPVHFQTTLQCIKHYAIFSDLEEEFDGHHIHDVLSGVSVAMKNSVPEFRFYRELHENRERMTRLTRENTSVQRDAWDLDKWKFLPMVQRALQEAKQDTKWFMFIEADTFLIWSNLLKWLAQLDWRRAHFLGLPVTMEDQRFAYGGAGWLLSRPAIQQITHHIASRNDSYEDFTTDTSFGDLILGYVLEQAGLGLTGGWPLIQRETPSTMEYTKELTCYPVEWLADVQAPLLHFDIFDRLVYPFLATRIDDWDNFSYGKQKVLTADEGFEDCRIHYEKDAQCMQFRFTPKKCTLSHSIVLGWKADPSVTSVSGWMMERIIQLRSSVRCNGEQWLPID
ncbi:hypothetical protein BDW75DRAFT_234587 [Aspergillus navahoensis]